jgi:hypothetical protein
MRIALVTTGVERPTLDLANQLARMGHETIVVAVSEHLSGAVSGYAYKGAWVRPVAAGDMALQRLVDVLREESSDVVHVMQPTQLPQAFEAAQRLALPVVTHVPDYDGGLEEEAWMLEGIYTDCLVNARP